MVCSKQQNTPSHKKINGWTAHNLWKQRSVWGGGGFHHFSWLKSRCSSLQPTDQHQSEQISMKNNTYSCTQSHEQNKRVLKVYQTKRLYFINLQEKPTHSTQQHMLTPPPAPAALSKAMISAFPFSCATAYGLLFCQVETWAFGQHW